MNNSLLILICDDQMLVHETVGEYLKLEGIKYISAYDGVEALEMYKKHNPDLILLDLMMPKMFGIDVCKEIRKVSDVPIIMLTAMGETMDKIIGLEVGADDYIVKPFSPREVVTRIKTVLRRIVPNDKRRTCIVEQYENIVRYKNLKIDLDKYEIYISDKPINVTPKEMKIFHLLASNPGITMKREHILSEVWGYDYFGDTRVVDTQIKRLRKKLPIDNIGWEIKSIYGIGYKFEVLNETKVI